MNISQTLCTAHFKFPNLQNFQHQRSRDPSSMAAVCGVLQQNGNDRPSQPEKLGGRSTGVDLLSKLELQSERNEKPATYYSSLAYTVCMKSALHVCTVKDSIRPHVFGRVLNCRQLALYSTRSPLEPNGQPASGGRTLIQDFFHQKIPSLRGK